jgi:hypothetical protein
MSDFPFCRDMVEWYGVGGVVGFSASAAGKRANGTASDRYPIRLFSPHIRVQAQSIASSNGNTVPTHGRVVPIVLFKNILAFHSLQVLFRAGCILKKRRRYKVAIKMAPISFVEVSNSTYSQIHSKDIHHRSPIFRNGLIPKTPPHRRLL